MKLSIARTRVVKSWMRSEGEARSVCVMASLSIGSASEVRMPDRNDSGLFVEFTQNGSTFPCLAANRIGGKDPPTRSQPR